MPFDRAIDVRVEKVFKIGDDRLGLYADMLNLFNTTVITGIQTRYPNVVVTGISTPIPGGAPGSVSAPRQVNLGARWTF